MLRKLIPLVLAFSLFTVGCSKKNQSGEASQPGNANQTASQQQQQPSNPAQPTPGQAQPAPMVPPPAETQTATSTPPPAPAPRAQKKSSMPQGDMIPAAKPFSGTQGQAAKPAAVPAPVVIPAGTNITVRLSQTIDAKNNQAGDVFHGTVASPVVVKGKTLIPTSAPVSGTIVSATAPGRFSGEGKLSIHLTRVTIRGTSYPITTSALTTSVQGKGKRSAVMVGGGTGAGALIGGLAGGGKGAAIGALIGAGGGAAGAGLTGNKVVGFPAESAITFKLQHSIDLTKRSSTATEEEAAPQNEEPQLQERQQQQSQQPPQ